MVAQKKSGRKWYGTVVMMRFDEGVRRRLCAHTKEDLARRLGRTPRAVQRWLDVQAVPRRLVDKLVKLLKVNIWQFSPIPRNGLGNGVLPTAEDVTSILPIVVASGAHPVTGKALECLAAVQRVLGCELSPQAVRELVLCLKHKQLPHQLK